MPRTSPDVSQWVHHTAMVEEGVKIHYVRVKPKEPNGQSLVLLHGYPSTLQSFRFVIQPFADLGFDVIAVDYRGAGGSNKPTGGYDKMTMSRDIHTLYHEVLGISSAIICGYDIGSMVACSLALQFRDDVTALITLEAPQPGTAPYEMSTTDPAFTWSRTFHYFFHNTPDLPELLTAGKERQYVQHFLDRLCYDPSFYTVQDLDQLEMSFAAPGAMRAGFELYRAFHQDAIDLQADLAARGKITIPCLASGGQHSRFTRFIERQTREFANDVTFCEIPHSNHWCPEENPEGFVEAVYTFLFERELCKNLAEKQNGVNGKV